MTLLYGSPLSRGYASLVVNVREWLAKVLVFSALSQSDTAIIA